ncbi:MAG: EamA family transporter [Bacteroidales bacterium]|nr:EamA family transporter [Bacteroidales bacterium]
MRPFNSHTLAGHAAMLFANIIWGFMAPVSKYVMSFDSVSSFAVTGFRVAGACVLFWIASIFLKNEKVERKDKIRLLFASMLAVMFNQGLFVTGVSMTSPVDASVITTFLPVITMVISAVILSEPITFLKVGGIVLGISGALILVLTAAASNSGSNIWGDICCICAQFSFAFYVVLFKDLVAKYSPITVMKWMFLFATLIFVPFLLPDMAAVDYSALPSSAYWGIVQVVVGGTFICYFLIPVGQHRLRPTVVVMYNYVQPLVATSAALAVGMDTFSPWKVLAAVLIFAGVFTVTQSRAKDDVVINNHKSE